MRAKFPQPDGRGILPRKWSTLKTGGPLIYFAEKVLKWVIQHGYPALYEPEKTNRLFPVAVNFSNELGETVGFLQCLQDACEIAARALRVTFSLVGCRLTLAGDWEMRLSGALPPIVEKDDAGEICGSRPGGRWTCYAGETLPGKPDRVKIVPARDVPF